MINNQLSNQEQQARDRATPLNWLTPAVDIYESSNDLVLQADLPGVTDQGLQLQVSRGVLTLEALIPSDQDDPQQGYYRQFRISASIDADAAEAALKDGVLTLRLPKSEAAKPKQIAVKTLH